MPLRLPEKLREILRLRVVAGMSAEETGRALGMTPGAAFDVDRAGLAEGHIEAVLGFEQGGDDFLLDLAVQADGDVVSLVDLDEWVLFGQLGGGLKELGAVAGGDDGFEGRACEELANGGGRYAELVADADVLESRSTTIWPASAGCTATYVRAVRVPVMIRAEASF